MMLKALIRKKQQQQQQQETNHIQNDKNYISTYTRFLRLLMMKKKEAKKRIQTKTHGQNTNESHTQYCVLKYALYAAYTTQAKYTKL